MRSLSVRAVHPDMRKRKRDEFRVLGVDPSLNSTGIACPDYTTHTIPDMKLRGMERVAYVARFMDAMLETDKPTHICMEGYAMAAKGRVFDLAELGGVLKLLFLSRGFPIVLVPPQTLKLYASGKGNASKEVVMKEIKRRWDRSFVESDRADAFALQQFGLDYLRGSTESVGEVRALGKAEILSPIEEIAIVCKNSG